jgi:hypothetical protein
MHVFKHGPGGHDPVEWTILDGTPEPEMPDFLKPHPELRLDEIAEALKTHPKEH